MRTGRGRSAPLARTSGRARRAPSAPRSVELLPQAAHVDCALAALAGGHRSPVSYTVLVPVSYTHLRAHETGAYL
eukprot:2767964-Pyramimonas_sp.AAC.1